MTATKSAASPPAGKISTPERALSICQPWAWLVASGYKTIENRTWANSYRGPVVIHASSSGRHYTPENDKLIQDLAHPKMLAELEDPRFQTDPDFDVFHFGALIGVAELVDILPLDKVEGQAADILAATGSDIPPAVWAEGPLCWVFANALRFAEPIPAKGKLNLYTLSPAEIQGVAKAIAKAKQ